MTPGEVAKVLGTCALYDYRDVTEFDVVAWFKVIGDLGFEEATEAVARHYRDATERIMPAHLRRLVKQIREERRRQEAQRSGPLALPSKFEDDMNRQVNMAEGMGSAKQVLAALAEHLASQSTPTDSAMDELRALTAGPVTVDGEVLP